MPKKIPGLAEEDEPAQLRAAQEARLRSMNSLQWVAMQAEHAFEAGLDLCVPKKRARREGLRETLRGGVLCIAHCRPCRSPRAWVPAGACLRRARFQRRQTER